MYSVGDKVVCAGHGAGEVVGVEQRELGGRQRDYLTIEIAHHGMTVMVPVDRAGSRLRKVISSDAVDEVLDMLRSGEPSMPQKWVARSKRMNEILGAGDALEVAAVVRDLAVRGTVKGLPVGEKQLLSRAQKHLASELMYARGLSEDEARDLLDESLGSLHPVPVPV